MVLASDALKIERFNFTSFESEVEPAAPVPQPESVAEEAPPPAPVFSEAELAAARDAAHKKGVEEGRAAAEAAYKKEDIAQQQALHKLLEVIANRITLAAEDHGKQLENQRTELYPLALAIAKKIAGVALQQDMYAPLENVLQQCSALVISEPSVAIVVSEEFAAPLAAHMEKLRTFLAGFEGVINVKSDPMLQAQDCRVEWQRGFIEHNTQRLWADIEKLLLPTTIPEG